VNSQFTVKSFARGVKLTIEHVWDPTGQIWTAVQNTNVQGQQVFAPFTMSWTFTPDSASSFRKVSSDYLTPRTCLPMVFPPPQEEFNAISKTYQNAPQLTELSVAFDQRANPYGITDASMVMPPYSSATNQTMPGQLADVLMSRYDFSLKLIQKVPTVFSDTTFQPYQTVLTLDFPGEALFGSANFNPYLVEGLSVYLNPYAAYYWVFEAPGLYYAANLDGTQTSCIQRGNLSTTLVVAGYEVKFIADVRTASGVVSHVYTYTIAGGDDFHACMVGLAAAIDAHDGFTATVDGDVIIINNALPFDGEANFTDPGSPSITYPLVFEISVPPLCMPNFTVAAKFRMPLMARDFSANANPASDPYVQNIPTKTLGKPQTSTEAFPEPTPAPDDLITGDDWQGVVTSLEQPLLDKLRSGYGREPGIEGDTFPWEQLAKDAGYQVINVQLFPNTTPTRMLDLIAESGFGFPYFSGYPSPHPFSDQRFVRVPEGFVVHHVIVAQNCFPYPTPTINLYGSEYGNPNPGLQKVGVALYNGVRSDDQQFQQIAYLEWDESTYANYLIDRLSLSLYREDFLLPLTDYRLLNCPLVWNSNSNAAASYGGTAVNTGKPFWMGAGNSTTQTRTPCYNMPANFGGTSSGAPNTHGGENLLVVRWWLELPDTDPLPALNYQDVLTGPGGHQVILIGKQSVVGSDTGDKVVPGNPAVGTW